MKTKDVRLYARGKMHVFGKYDLKIISKLDKVIFELTPSLTHTLNVVTFPAKVMLGMFPHREKLSEDQKMAVMLKFTGEDVLTCEVPRNLDYYNAHKVG